LLNFALIVVERWRKGF